MEKIAHYRAIVVQIIEQEAQRSALPDVEICQICDDVHQHYQLLYLGWQATQRVFAPGHPFSHS